MRRGGALLTSTILLLVLIFLSGCTDADGQEIVGGKLGRRIQGIVASKKLKGALVTVKVHSITDRESIYELNANNLVSVASNMKIATTAAALMKLGSRHRLKTILYRRGKIESGILNGDLVILGMGDPNISGRLYGSDTETVLRSWANALVAVGVERIKGSVISDATAYGQETIPPGWPQNQLERWYCAPVSALSINDNCFDVTVAPGQAPGKPAVAYMRPRAGVSKLVNQCTTTSKKSKHLISVVRLPGKNEVIVKGAFWNGSNPQVFPITLHNPPIVFASALADALARQGIKVDGDVKVASEPVDTSVMIPVAEHSTILPVAMAVTNKRSQNLHAEILLRELGRKSGSGSREGGIKALVSLMGSIGIPKEQVSPADGCGLDKNSRMSASAIVALLLHMRKSGDFQLFRESLAVSGHDGTLENRLATRDHAGRVWAKTGYIRGVSALSGYAVNRSGKEYAFSILFNKAEKLSNTFMKSVQDEVVAAILESR